MRVFVVLFLVMSGLSMAVDSYLLDEQPVIAPGVYLDEPLDEPSPASDRGDTSSVLSRGNKSRGDQQSSRNGGFLANTDVYDQARPRVSHMGQKIPPPPPVQSVSIPKANYKEITKPTEETLKKAAPSMGEMATATVIEKYLTFRNVATVGGLVIVCILAFFRKVVDGLEKSWLRTEYTGACIASDLKGLIKRFVNWVRSRDKRL